MIAPSVSPSLLADAVLERELRSFFGPRAAEVDACRCTVREGVAYAADLGVLELGADGRPDGLERMCEVIATVAMDDMAQAFSLWAHRMAVEYLHCATGAETDLGVSAKSAAGFLGELRSVARLGSTSFAAATSNFLGGTPLSLTYREVDSGIAINGRIAWASNLEAPFVSVAAAAREDDPEERIVFAYTECTEGLRLPAYPELLALQATQSTSPVFENAFVSEECLLTRDFTSYVAQVLPAFLLLQCSFCWGLANRCLHEAQALLTGTRASLEDEAAGLCERYGCAELKLRGLARSDDKSHISHRELLELRLEWSRIATSAVALEAKLAGGRGYTLGSDTARRFREAAFLPIQSPTEVQLRWLLSLYK